MENTVIKQSSPIPQVMVVDDETLNLKLIGAMLKPFNYNVVLAESGEECLKKVYENPPDIILLDIIMPGLNGFEVAKTLKTHSIYKNIPIVMVTALQNVEDRVKALDVGADDFLSKPVDRMELIARVRSLLTVKAYNDHMVNYRQELEKSVKERTAELAEANKQLAQANKQLEKAHNQLREASLETIFRLSKAAEYKDSDTGSHIISMSRISAYIARKVGFDKEAVNKILYASPMHDIGKIGIPDSILLKKSSLNEEEWEIMRKHTIYGANILSDSQIDFLKLGKIVAITHHERWDGAGYPNGLKGEDIPIAGRIVAISDVFDALLSKRPYKEAMEYFEALDIILKGRGTHFDPDLVDLFQNNFDEILDVWQSSQVTKQNSLQNSLQDSLNFAMPHNS